MVETSSDVEEMIEGTPSIEGGEPSSEEPIGGKWPP